MKSVFLFFFLLIAHYGQAQMDITAQIANSANGKTIPDFFLQTPKGDSINIYSLEADYILIDIWATWCGPCKAQQPTFDSLRLANADKNWLFISVSIDDNPKKWMNYIKKKGTERQYLASNPQNPIWWFAKSESDTPGSYFFGIPRYVILDKNHMIVNRDGQIHDGSFQEAVKQLK